MAKSKALLAAEQRIAALEAQLVVANEACANQRMRIAALEAAINTRGTKPAPVVTHYPDRFGRVWEKVRVGNQATSRIVSECAH